MKVVYDSSVDAAYIQLVNVIEPGAVVFSYPCDPKHVGGMIHLDFDAHGVLVGIEVLAASELLPSEILETGTET